jgi:hypothetical protein
MVFPPVNEKDELSVARILRLVCDEYHALSKIFQKNAAVFLCRG